MLIRKRNTTARRRGATVVEMALVSTIFLMFIFGILEYCRYLMFLHVANNATRDGARYASVNVIQSTDFDYNDAVVFGTTTPLLNTLGQPLVSITKYTRQRMSGVENMLQNFTVEVFPCDTDEMYKSTPVIRPKPGWTTNPVTRSVHWNSALFTERIGVRIKGDYKPILPNLLLMSQSINFDIVSVMGSEG